MRSPAWFPAGRRPAIAAALLLCVLTLLQSLVVSPPSARAAGEQLQLEQSLVGGGSEVTSMTTPSDSGRTLVLKYRCDSSENPCQGGNLSVTIPDGLQIGTVGTSANVRTAGGSGQTRTFAMFDLAPGTTGAISVDLHIPGNDLPDGTSWTWTAAMTADNTPSVTSNAVDITARAASTPRADGQFLTGGGVGGLTRYRISGCNDRRQPDTTWGPLAVTGSELTVTLPEGAVIVEGGGGTASATAGVTTLRWTFGHMGNGCASPEILVSYPTTDPGNVVGAEKQLAVAWSGRLFGETADHALGAKSFSHVLTAPEASVSPFKRVNTPRSDGSVNQATVGDLISYDLGGDNAGTVTLDTFEVSDTLPDGVQVSQIDAYNHGRQAGTLWVATLFGADGVQGTGDDDQLVQERALPARSGTQVSYASLAAGDAVTRVRLLTGEVRPSEGGNYVHVTATVLRRSRSGVDAVGGMEIRNEATFGWTSTIDGDQSTGGVTKPARFVIDMPQPGLYVRHNGAIVASGSRVTPTMSLMAAPVVDADLADPVFVLQLPPGFSVDTWDGPSDLPTATMTTLTNWRGTGDTLVRWTFPRGTIAEKDHAYQFDYKLRLVRGIYSSRTIRGYINSSTQSVSCYQNFFDGAADVDDRDGDGNTSEVLCPWFASVDHPTSSAAVLTTSVKGQWDPRFVDAPGTGMTRPGGDDTYRLTLESQATMGLDGASIIDVLPRAGDTNVVGGARRNPTSRTFPVLLRGRPQIPELEHPTTTLYSTATKPCRTEYGFTASGCNPADWTDWDATPPADLTAVTAIKVVFGDNVLTPGDSWTIDLPVTTPTSGAVETDFAAENPDPLRPADDETAQHTAAFEVRRADLNATLLPSESLPVGLRVPSAYGPADQPVEASGRTSTGAGTDTQEVHLSAPAGGSVALVEGGRAVSEIVAPGVGRYTLDLQTGDLRFEPALGYVGTPPAVTYRRVNVFGTHADASYTPTVTRPDLTAPARTSTGVGTAPQVKALGVPVGGEVRLLWGGDPVTSVIVPGEGTHVLDTATGVVTFTPVFGFHGTATAVPFRITDAYGSHADATYTPTVTSPAPAGVPDESSSGVGTAPQTVTLPIPAGGQVRLVDPQGREVTALTVPGDGSYELEPSTGVVTFTPMLGFKGASRPVTYRVTDAYGQTMDATYTPAVTVPAGPSAAPQASVGRQAETQVRIIEIPPGGHVDLVDASGTLVRSLRIPGEGEYVLDPVAGTLTFIPVRGFTGKPRPAIYRVTDAYGQTVDAAYQPDVEATGVGAVPAATPGACVSRRVMTVNWRVPAGSRLTRIRVTINGKPLVRLDGAVRQVTVDLKGRPKQTVAVKVLATTTRGRTLGTTRIYQTCALRPGAYRVQTLKLGPVRR